MRHLLLAAFLVAMTGCGSDTKPEDQPTATAETASQEEQPAAPMETATQEDQPTAPEETVSSPETPNGSDEPSAEADVSIENSIGMRFVPIPAGTFTMGDADNGPTHKVTLTKPFELGQHEVTQEQYKLVMRQSPMHIQRPSESCRADELV